jgi:hypothetical protein
MKRAGQFLRKNVKSAVGRGVRMSTMRELQREMEKDLEEGMSMSPSRNESVMSALSRSSRSELAMKIVQEVVGERLRGVVKDSLNKRLEIENRRNGNYLKSAGSKENSSACLLRQQARKRLQKELQRECQKRARKVLSKEITDTMKNHVREAVKKAVSETQCEEGRKEKVSNQDDNEEVGDKGNVKVDKNPNDGDANDGDLVDAKLNALKDRLLLTLEEKEDGVSKEEEKKSKQSNKREFNVFDSAVVRNRNKPQKPRNVNNSTKAKRPKKKQISEDRQGKKVSNEQLPAKNRTKTPMPMVYNPRKKVYVARRRIVRKR